MSRKAFRYAILGLAGAGLLSACADGDVTGDPTGGQVESDRANLKGSSARAVKNALRAKGRGAEADTIQEQSEVASGQTGLTHVRMEQVLDGLRVHGAFVKAGVNDLGDVVYMKDRLARPNGHVPAGPARERDVLAAVLAQLGYEPGDLGAATGVQGNVSRFARGSVFHRDPTVERVAYVDDNGATRAGFLVETWSVVHNQLDHTLVDGRGNVVSVERRTANDSYAVYVEDPGKGGQTTVSGPGAGNAESPAGWLGTGAQTTTNVSGNNAHAYLDKDANNAPDTGGTAVTSGNFAATADLSASPATTGNLQVAVQNLFYLNNFVHDVLYRHGFNEAAGNFQINNFAGGGSGNDPVNAEAQDGSGTDNANFSTPADGSSPRMQMYLWSGVGPNAFVTAGGSQYGAYSSSFGKALTTTPTANSALALANDGTGVATDGCEKSIVSLSGKTALVDRGSCDFTVKVLNAQNAGAVAVIIVNNVAGDSAFSPGGTNRRVKIASVMVGQNTGNTLKARVGTLANLRKNAVPPLQIDGDLDSDVVFHEYGHGLTWRMVGSMSGPLSGAIGEGASDVVAFLINGDDKIGEYAASNPNGIRSAPYDAHSLTYKNVTGAEVHQDGEIYAAAMWDVFQLYLAAGYSADDVFDDFVGGLLPTQPGPSFEDMRDGMLIAAPTAARQCLIWHGFAGKGIGVGASGTVAGGTVTIVESFQLPANCP